MEQNSSRMANIFSVTGVTKLMATGSDTTIDADRFLEYHNVRIYPSKIVFKDAYERKKFRQKLTITNCGSESAFVRICSASSYAFKIQPILRGQYLAPGLSIVRYISFTYMFGSAVPGCWLPIFINGKEVIYKMTVTVSVAKVSVEPQELDFGTIDAGQSASVRTLLIRNDGCKSSRFAIDLSGNAFELIVEPVRGVLEAGNAVSVRVELMTCTEGSFLKEFWIKTDIPLRVKVKAFVIAPKLETCDPNSTVEFTLVAFPRTYYGASCLRTLVVKNYSSVRAMYCLTADVHNQAVEIEEAEKKDSDYKNFTVGPIDGRLQPYEGKIFNFVFSPVTIENQTNDEVSHMFCCYRIVRIECTDITGIDFSESSDDGCDEENAVCTLRSSSSVVLPTLADNLSELSNNMEETTQEIRLEKNLLLICVHGEAETAGITIRPNALNLIEMVCNRAENRELKLTNCSRVLPIFFKYKKVCFVEVTPSSGILNPSQSLEVNVKITPCKIGTVRTEITFDLLCHDLPVSECGYRIVGSESIATTFTAIVATAKPEPKFNLGITPACTNEVGFLTEEVTFGSLVQKPRAAMIDAKFPVLVNDKEFIAFPNDRPTTIRPWKNIVRCRTIFAGIPRNRISRDPFELTGSELELKNKTKTYYCEYTRNEAKKLRQKHHVRGKVHRDYALTDKKHLLLECLSPVKMPSLVGAEEKIKYPSFIPMTPSQLNNICIGNKNMKLGKVACNSRSMETIPITNRNSFAVRVFIRPLKSCIDCPHGSRTVLKAFSEAQMAICFRATVMGRTNVVVEVIINESHCFEVTLTADVVPKCIKLDTSDVVFELDGARETYLMLYNPLNVSVDFQWEFPDGCFIMEPVMGTIPSRRRICCRAAYFPDTDSSTAIEMTLCSEGGMQQPINFSVNMTDPSVTVLNEQVILKNIPLNLVVNDKAVLRNNGYYPVTFQVLNPQPMTGINIDPTEGMIPIRSDQILNIFVQLKACISFQCAVLIEIQSVAIVEFTISGTVIYPNLTISPESLHMRKIMIDSFDRLAFVVDNRSPAKAIIQFEFNDFPEYIVAESKDDQSILLPEDGLALSSGERKKLYLHFTPQDVATFSMNLPVVINKILGPPLNNSVDSQTSNYYLGEYETEYLKSDMAKKERIPSKLPIINVFSGVGGQTIRFSALNLDFSYFPHQQYSELTQIDFKIWNAGKERAECCIRTDDLFAPFAIIHMGGTEIEEYNKAIVCRLESEEEAYFSVEFFPSDPGEYEIKLPIYLRNYLQGSVFNYLTLKGVFPLPTISTSETVIYFEPVPLRTKTEVSLYLIFSYHIEECSVSTETDTPDLAIVFPKGRSPSQDEPVVELPININFMYLSSQCFNSTISFTCTCGVSCSVDVKGCAENCLLTTHAFLRTYTQKIINGVVPEKSDIGFVQSRSKLALLSDIPPTDPLDSISILSRSNIFDAAVNDNETPYPYFPDSYDDSEYADYMKCSIEVIENWMFYQGFYGKSYYNIPEGIAAFPVVLEQKEKKNKTRDAKTESVVLTYVRLLINLAGPGIKKLLISRKMPTENLDRISHIHATYQHALKILADQGAYLPHVSPEQLLEYGDYKHYIVDICKRNPEKCTAGKDLIQEDEFFLISKQSWMDVLLQTYKVFVLERIKFPKKPFEKRRSLRADSRTTLKSTSSHYLLQHTKSFNKFLELSLHHNMNIYGDSETTLLLWLEYYYHHYRTFLWPPQTLHQGEETPGPREVRFFDYDLTDSIVLAGVTAYFCPYLTGDFRDLYLNPKSPEEIFHNAAVLIQAWNKVKFSFPITAMDIVHPNGIKMVMLVNYLYDILPTIYPEECVYMLAKFTKSCSQQIVITNSSDKTITYSLVFFDNEDEYFVIQENVDTITIAPQKDAKITITFHARKLKMAISTLVLCGDIPGTYAKSTAFKLMGEPDITYFTTKFTIPASVYCILQPEVKIQSPYAVAASYEIFFSLEEPVSILSLDLHTWANVQNNKVPSRLLIKETILECDENGVGTIHLTIGCIVPLSTSTYFFFTNKDVGSFNVDVTIISTTDLKHRIQLESYLPRGLDDIQCTCRKGTEHDSTCARRILVNVPSRNDQMWEAIEGMFVNLLNDFELKFWTKYLGTHIGMRLLKHIMESSRAIVFPHKLFIFNKSIEYNILSDCNAVSFPPTLKIEDIISFNPTKLYFQIDCAQPVPEEFHITMESPDGKELRFYTIRLVDLDKVCNPDEVTSSESQLDE